MSREAHAGFCESRGVRFPPATHRVVLCPTKVRAERARAIAETTLATLGLRLHPEKTRIVNLTKGAEGFDFLGFHNHMCESQKWPGRYYLYRWPSKRAMSSIRTKVREMTDRRYVGHGLETAAERLNPVLRGWAGYFRYGHSSRKFGAVDAYVHERMAILASNKYGLSGRNWVSRFNYEWFSRLEIYRLVGTVRSGSAHALR